MLFTRLKDDVHLAQVDETRARVMLAEGRVVEAEKTARAAVRTLEKGDELSLLAEALTTHGTALARLKHPEQARTTLERALEVAERAGDLESAGNAAMVLIEELGTFLSNDDLKATVDRARDLLTNTQDLSTLKRLATCAARVLSLVHASPRFPASVDWSTFSFRRSILEYEAHFIRLALEDTGGVVSRAARLLGFNHHQSLLALLNGRHEVLRHRSTPIVPRRRSIIRHQASNGSHPRAKRRSKHKMKILHVEDNQAVARMVQERLELDGCEVEICADGTQALEKITSNTHYNLLLLDNELPGISGVQLAQHARRPGPPPPDTDHHPIRHARRPDGAPGRSGCVFAQAGRHFSSRRNSRQTAAVCQITSPLALCDNCVVCRGLQSQSYREHRP